MRVEFQDWSFLILSDVRIEFLLKANSRGADWINKTNKKKRIRQVPVISLYSEIHEDDNYLIPFILKTKYYPRA